MNRGDVMKPGRVRNVAIGAVVVAVAALLAAGGWLLMGGKAGQPKKPPKIALIEAPPPPPPPKVEKKPEPPKEVEQKEIKLQQPQPKPDAPQPSPELKMEGPAGDGPSAFAAGKITNEDLSKIGKGKDGGGGGGLFNPFKNYANLLKGEVQRYLGKNAQLRKRHYSVDVRVWVAPDGAVKRFEVLDSTGDGETDAAIQQALAALPAFNEPPPNKMPQPIQLRITTTG